MAAGSISPARKTRTAAISAATAAMPAIQPKATTIIKAGTLAILVQSATGLMTAIPMTAILMAASLPPTSAVAAGTDKGPGTLASKPVVATKLAVARKLIAAAQAEQQPEGRTPAAAKRAKTQSKKNTLVVGTESEPETMNFTLNTTLAGIRIIDLFLRPPIKLNQQGKLEPVLVTKIPSVENGMVSVGAGGKGARVKLELLPEAVWGDGTPLTCKDLRLAWIISQDLKVSSARREELSNIKEIEFTSAQPKSCTFVLEKMRFDFLTGLPRPMPAHIEEPIYEKFKGEAFGYDRNSAYAKDIKNPGLSIGPYRITDWVLGSHIALTRNEKYFGKPANIEKILFKFITNSAALDSNLLAGNVDMLSLGALSLDQAFNLEKKIKSQNLPYKIQYTEIVAMSFLSINLDKDPLSDQRVRKALYHALDLRTFTKSIFEGKQNPAPHFSTKWDEWYTTDPKKIATYSFNRSKANSLLDEAGWKMGPGKFRMKDGKKLSFELNGVSESKLSETIQAFVKEGWRRIGVEAIIQNVPARVFFGENFKKRKFDVALSSWISSPDSLVTSLYHSSAIPNEKNSFVGSNRMGWSNPKVDELLDKVEGEMNQKKRIEMMQEVLRIFTEELPQIPLWTRVFPVVLPLGLKGYIPSPHNHTEYLDAENWRWE